METNAEPIPVIVVTGPVGAGKSTVAVAMSELLERRQVRHVMIDQDYLRRVYPSPAGDRFAARLGYRNLAAIWPNMLEIAPRCVIVADVVEDRAQSLADYAQALPGTQVTIARLDVPMSMILERLTGRESDESIDWFWKRAPELQAIMEREHVEDILIDAGDRTPYDVALEILERCGVASPAIS
jgi:adenylylsulfate kinase